MNTVGRRLVLVGRRVTGHLLEHLMSTSGPIDARRVVVLSLNVVSRDPFLVVSLKLHAKGG